MNLVKVQVRCVQSFKASLARLDHAFRRQVVTPNVGSDEELVPFPPLDCFRNNCFRLINFCSVNEINSPIQSSLQSVKETGSVPLDTKYHGGYNPEGVVESSHSDD